MKLNKFSKILLLILGIILISCAVFVWPGKLANWLAQKYQAKQKENVASLEEDASSKMGNDKYGEAKPILEEVVKKDPTNANAWVNLGICYLSSKEYDSAAAAFEKAIQLNPNAASYYVLLANLQRDTGKIDEAIKNYQKAIAVNKRELNAYVNLASLYYNQKKYNEAIETLKKAKTESPKFMEFRYMLASYYKNLGQTANFKSEVNEILAINPNDKWAKANK